MASEPTETRPLDALGISKPEERAYRWMLSNPDATIQELAQALALTQGKAQRLLDTIEAKGLVTHSPERPRRYIPAAPDIALNALVHRRQEGLQRAKAEIEKLQEQTATSRHGEQEPMVELITSREAERQVFERIHQSAQHEVLALVRAPLRISRPEVSQDYETQREAQTRGISYRSVVDTEFLTLPGAMRAIWQDMKAGEEVRVVSHLPLKIVLVDQQLAIIPLNLEELDSPVLLVRSSALLEALYALFEVLWERAAPISFTRTGTLRKGVPDPLLSDDAKDLLSLMATGLNDKKIADEVGLSLRTLYRHIAELMKTVDARTRFQFGWLAALRMSGVSGMESNAD